MGMPSPTSLSPADLEIIAAARKARSLYDAAIDEPGMAWIWSDIYQRMHSTSEGLKALAEAGRLDHDVWREHDDRAVDAWWNADGQARARENKAVAS